MVVEAGLESGKWRLEIIQLPKSNIRTCIHIPGTYFQPNMFYINALILGIVQGITEFLPVSSSGHLVVLHDILKMGTVNNLAFDVALHIGTLLALIIYFRVDLLRYVVAVLELFIPKRPINRADLSDVLLLIYASIPAALAGFLFAGFIEERLRNAWVVVGTLLVGAVLFFLVERFGRHEHDFTGLGIGKALYIGCAQALALIPGVSRSGITIVAGMSVKLKRTEAAKFSFLLSIPAVFGAGVFEFFDISWSTLSSSALLSFIVGLTASFIVGYFVIKYFLRFLEHHKLNAFGWYRIGLAIIIGAWLLLK